MLCQLAKRVLRFDVVALLEIGREGKGVDAEAAREVGKVMAAEQCGFVLRGFRRGTLL